MWDMSRDMRDRLSRMGRGENLGSLPSYGTGHFFFIGCPVSRIGTGDTGREQEYPAYGVVLAVPEELVRP